MGDREKNLLSALEFLNDPKSGYKLNKISKIYETEPVGYTHQNKFLNMVCSIHTSLDPFQLLSLLQKIEIRLQRKRIIHWGPRTIDLDILLYDSLNIRTESLTVPHPRMLERAFVLIPLLDIYSEGQIRRIPIDRLIEKCEDRTGIVLYKRMSCTSENP